MIICENQIFKTDLHQINNTVRFTGLIFLLALANKYNSDKFYIKF